MTDVGVTAVGSTNAGSCGVGARSVQVGRGLFLQRDRDHVEVVVERGGERIALDERIQQTLRRRNHLHASLAPCQRFREALLIDSVETGDISQDESAGGLCGGCEFGAGLLSGLFEPPEQQFDRGRNGRIRANQENVGLSRLKDVPVVNRHSEVAGRQTPLESAPTATINYVVTGTWCQAERPVGTLQVMRVASADCGTIHKERRSSPMTRQVVLLVESNPRVARHHPGFPLPAGAGLSSLRVRVCPPPPRHGPFRFRRQQPAPRRLQRPSPGVRRQSRRRDAMHRLHRIARAGACPGRAARGRVLRSRGSPACHAAGLSGRQPAVRPIAATRPFPIGARRFAAGGGAGTVNCSTRLPERSGPDGAMRRTWHPVRSSHRRPHQFVGFDGPPASRVVLAEREIGAQHAVDDAPGGFDAGLAAEQGAVAAQRIAEEALVRRHLVAGVVVLDESHVLADHRLARNFRPCGQRDAVVGAQPEVELVRAGGRGGIEQRTPGFFSRTRTSFAVTARLFRCGWKMGPRPIGRLSIRSRAAM